MISQRDAGLFGIRRILVKRAVWYEIFAPVIISAFARCNWCVPIILLSIRYNVCVCRNPTYCCISGTTCSPYLSKSKISLRHCYCVFCKKDTVPRYTEYQEPEHFIDTMRDRRTEVKAPVLVDFTSTSAAVVVGLLQKGYTVPRTRAL